MGFSVVNIAGLDIVDGNKKILAIVAVVVLAGVAVWINKESLFGSGYQPLPPVEQAPTPPPVEEAPKAKGKKKAPKAENTPDAPAPEATEPEAAAPEAPKKAPKKGKGGSTKEKTVKPYG